MILNPDFIEVYAEIPLNFSSSSTSARELSIVISIKSQRNSCPRCQIQACFYLPADRWVLPAVTAQAACINELCSLATSEFSEAIIYPWSKIEYVCASPWTGLEGKKHIPNYASLIQNIHLESKLVLQLMETLM